MERWRIPPTFRAPHANDARADGRCENARGQETGYRRITRLLRVGQKRTSLLPGVPGGTGHLVLDLGEQPGLRLFPAVRRPGPGPGVPAADVAVRIVWPGPVGDRPTVPEDRGAPAGRARRPGRRRRGTSRRGGIPPGQRGRSPSTAARTVDPGWSCSPPAGSRHPAPAVRPT